MSLLEAVGRAVEDNPVPVLGILGGCAAVVIIVVSQGITKAWRGVRTLEAEAALKQEMLDRGMSADEIVRVIAATRGASDGRSCRD